MANILVAPAMYSGHLLPHLAVAQALRSTGHSAIVYAEPEAEELVRQSDCEFVPMSIGGVREAFAAASTAAESCAAFLELAELSAPELVGIIGRRSVDVALIDSFHLGGALAALRCGVPWATLATTPSESHPSFADSPVHQLPAAALRQRLGLPPSSRSSYEQTCSEALYLQPWTSEFDGGAGPRSALTIGPLGWSAPDSMVPAGLLEEEDPDRPLVVVTVSSWSIEALAPFVQDYLDAAVAALGRLPVRAVVGLGPYRSPRVVPANVRVARFVPHSAVVPRARLLVTHGGWGSVSRGLLAGVPMVVIPFAADQPHIAELCERAGVGVYLPSELVSEDELAAIFDQLLDEKDPHHRAAVELADRIRAQRPAETAAGRILTLCGQARPQFDRLTADPVPSG